MVPKYDIGFVEADVTITEPATKFGGQPAWIGEPQWPLSRALDEQMQFICQVFLDPEIFGVPPGKMAYLFMTRGGESEDVGETFEPDGGENAVIVQPEGKNDAETMPEGEGPSLYTFIDGRSRDDGTVPCEYAVKLEAGEDPQYVDEDKRAAWSDEEHDSYYDVLVGNKVGGTPIFIQADEFPKGGPWRLLSQLDSMALPFHVNFGDTGIGYAYISEDEERGKFLWQCY